MEIDELEVVHLELKYCESCGGLWLRPKGSSQVECASCAARPKRSLERLGGTSRPRLPRLRSLELNRAQSNMPVRRPMPADWGTA